ncbi:MAG: pilus assembly protein PilM, partial [Chloroflexota bacterium]
MVNKILTIEINNGDIRLLEIEGNRIMRWASQPLAPSVFHEGVVVDRPALTEALRQLMVSSGARGGNVICSISGLYSLSRTLTVHTVAGEIPTQQTVVDTAREIMPVSEEEQYISWQTLATSESGYLVLLIGVPREMIDNEVLALKAANLNPRQLDLKPMALARAVNRQQALILNIGPSTLDIVIVANGLTEIMRTTTWQSDGLSPEENIESLETALELTVGFYDSHHPGFPLDLSTPLFVTGPMSGDATLVNGLRDRLNYSFEELIPPFECPPYFPAAQYAVNIGLALKGTTPSPKSPESGTIL